MDKRIGIVVMGMLVIGVSSGRLEAESPRGGSEKTVVSEPSVGFIASPARDNLKERRQLIQEQLDAARVKERDIRDQIRAAEKTGDQDKAQKLREELRVFHDERVRSLQQDRQNLNQTWKEMRGKVKEPGKGPSLAADPLGQEVDKDARKDLPTSSDADSGPVITGENKATDETIKSVP